MRHTGNDSGPDGIIGQRKDDGDRFCRVLGGLDGFRAAARHDEVDPEIDKLRGKSAKPLWIRAGISVLDDDVLALDPSELPQFLLEHHLVGAGRLERGKLPDPVHLSRRLRLGGDHRTRASEERATIHHWITSSARSRSDGGIVSPRALAVLRLMTNSNFVGCSTGRSPGLAPLRILST